MLPTRQAMNVRGFACLPEAPDFESGGRGFESPPSAPTISKAYDKGLIGWRASG